jgi:hypothetical protein
LLPTTTGGRRRLSIAHRRVSILCCWRIRAIQSGRALLHCTLVSRSTTSLSQTEVGGSLVCRPRSQLFKK